MTLFPSWSFISTRIGSSSATAFLTEFGAVITRSVATPWASVTVWLAPFRLWPVSESTAVKESV